MHACSNKVSDRISWTQGDAGDLTSSRFVFYTQTGCNRFGSSPYVSQCDVLRIHIQVVTMSAQPHRFRKSMCSARGPICTVSHVRRSLCRRRCFSRCNGQAVFGEATFLEVFLKMLLRPSVCPWCALGFLWYAGRLSCICSFFGFGARFIFPTRPGTRLHAVFPGRFGLHPL